MPRPPRAWRTWVQLPPSPVPLTFSTRWVFGHQRGRWYGSATTAQIALGGAAMRRLRTARAIGRVLLLAGQLPQVADEQHVGEVVDARGETLQVLDRLAAAAVVG